MPSTYKLIENAAKVVKEFENHTIIDFDTIVPIIEGLYPSEAVEYVHNVNDIRHFIIGDVNIETEFRDKGITITSVNAVSMNSQFAIYYDMTTRKTERMEFYQAPFFYSMKTLLSNHGLSVSENPFEWTESDWMIVKLSL